MPRPSSSRSSPTPDNVPPAAPELVVRDGRRLTLEVRFPAGVVLARPPDPSIRIPPSARPRCPVPNCHSLEVVLTSSRSIPGRTGRVYYYRCTRCVDAETLTYTRFKRLRLGVVNRPPPAVPGADRG